MKTMAIPALALLLSAIVAVLLSVILFTAEPEPTQMFDQNAQVPTSGNPSQVAVVTGGR